MRVDIAGGAAGPAANSRPLRAGVEAEVSAGRRRSSAGRHGWSDGVRVVHERRYRLVHRPRAAGGGWEGRRKEGSEGEEGEWDGWMDGELEERMEGGMEGWMVVGRDGGW